MYRTILVPLDGSALAERALPYAETLAGSTGARILLVRAVLVHALPGIDPTDHQVKAVREAEAYLSDLAGRLGRRGVVETAVFYGEAAEAILAEVALRQADLVVMATHGRSGLSRMVSGSVAEAVLARSPVPVLLVRAWQEGSAAPALRQRPRLLVPLDGSPFAEAALPVAADLAAQLGGDLVLLQAISSGPMLVADNLVVPDVYQPEPRADEVQRYLEQTAARLAQDYPRVPVVVEVSAGPPPEAIAAASRERGASLVVMATHGRTGVGRLLLGSVAAAVLQHGSVPLLLVRPEAIRQVEAAPARPATATAPAEARWVTIVLSPEELRLLRAGLTAILQNSGPGARQKQVRDLLGRLEQAGPAGGASASPAAAKL